MAPHGQPIIGGQCLPVARVERGDDGTVVSIGTAIVMTIYPEETDDAGSR
jgi:hypothetical protein